MSEAVLDFTVTQPLEIPASAFVDDIATVVVTGGSYGGMWVLNAISTHLPPDTVEPIGGIQTVRADRRPELALAAAHQWIVESCTVDLNLTYGPDEAPFFCSGQFIIDRRPVGPTPSKDE